MSENYNPESFLKESTNEGLTYDESGIRLMSKLFAPHLLYNQKGKILFHSQWKEFDENFVVPTDINRFTFLIEREEKLWVVLHFENLRAIDSDSVEENKQYEESSSSLDDDQKKQWEVQYYDPLRSIFPDKINTIIINNGVEQVRARFIMEHFDLVQSWLTSFRLAIFFSEGKKEVIRLDTLDLDESFQQSLISFWKELKKIKNKIKVCSETVSNAVTEPMPIIPDFEHANLFIFFLECLALQDEGLKCKELKNYFENDVIGLKNIARIRELRTYVLHRESFCVICPQDFQRNFFKNKSTKDIFQNLSLYLKKIEENIEGIESDYKFQEPFEILEVPDMNVGLIIEQKDVKQLLNDYASKFIKEGFPDNTRKQTGEMLFNFNINFVPFLEVQYKKLKKPFTEILNVRNQLIHNSYILYKVRPELPSISLRNVLPEFKEFFLKFILKSNFSAVLKDFPEDNTSEELEKKMELTLQDFQKQFSNDLCPVKDQYNIMALTRCTISKNQNFKHLIKKYVTTIPWIDAKNRLVVGDKTDNFSLPTEYVVLLNDIQRKKVFEQMILIKQLDNTINQKTKKTHRCLTGVEFDVLVDNIKNELQMSTGLEEEDFRLMYNSILNLEEEQNVEVTNAVIECVLKIKETSINETGSNALKIIQEFKEFANEMSDESKKMNTKNIRYFRTLNDINKEYEIIISDESVTMTLKHIVSNLLPILFNFTNRSIYGFESLEEVLNDTVFLKLLGNEFLKGENLKRHFDNIPFLVPLGVQLMEEKKLRFSDEDELKFMNSCIKPLLKPHKTKHLAALMAIKSKYSSEFLNECLEQLKLCISGLDLISQKPLFENNEFENKILKILKNTDELQNAKAKSSNVKILKTITNFKYISAMEKYRKKEYEKALEYIEGKKGFSKILKILLETQNLKPNYNVIFRLKCFIVEVKNALGVSSKRSNPDFDSNKQFTESLRILNQLLKDSENIISWQLRIYQLIAYTHHLLGQYEESCQEYTTILHTLLSLKKNKVSQNLVTHKTIIKQDNLRMLKKLIKSEKYKKAVKRSRRRLNILGIMNNIGFEFFCMGKNSSDIENKKISYYSRALEQYTKALAFQKEFLDANNFLVKTSCFNILRLAVILRFECNVKDINVDYSDFCRRYRRGREYQSRSWNIIEIMGKKLESDQKEQLFCMKATT